MRQHPERRRRGRAGNIDGSCRRRAHIHAWSKEGIVDGIQFDGWAKTIAAGRTSRQGLLRLAAGAGLAAMLGAAKPAAARRCQRNGSPCFIGGTRNCCSGRCHPFGIRGLGRCRARPVAKGCTIRDDSCAPYGGSSGVPCPQNANGRCFILSNGLPFCATHSNCYNCSSDDDCNRRFRRTRGHCIACESCSRDRGRFCVFP
jgi:hypothetical protein